MDAVVNLPHEFLFTVNAIRIRKSEVLVGDQWEGELKFLRKLFVGRGGVFAHSDYFEPGALKLDPSIADAAGFFGASGRVVFRVEIQQAGAVQ